MSPRFLYLHGFASSPASNKARAFAALAEERGVALERLDLRKPSFERLRLSAMIEHAAACLGGPRDRAVLIGSSLGGLTAARLAERDPRVVGLVLLAPALGLMDLWRARLGPAAMDGWRSTGWLEVDDHAIKGRARVDYGFYEDARASDPADAPDLRVPTLVVHGRADDVVPIEGSRALARGLRHVRLVEVEDGHELARTLPDVLAESARFLAPWGF